MLRRLFLGPTDVPYCGAQTWEELEDGVVAEPGGITTYVDETATGVDVRYYRVGKEE